MINYVLKPARHSFFFKKYAAKKFMKVLCPSHPRHVALTEMDGLRLARTYARGPLNDGRRTRKSTWQKNFLRSKRSSGLSASVRLPLASAQTRLTSWRRAGCGISHSLHRQSNSTHLFICQYNPQSPFDQPLSMNVPCTSAKTTPHPQMHVP
jgi:hypothetical protein